MAAIFSPADSFLRNAFSVIAVICYVASAVAVIHEHREGKNEREDDHDELLGHHHRSHAEARKLAHAIAGPSVGTKDIEDARGATLVVSGWQHATPRPGTEIAGIRWVAAFQMVRIHIVNRTRFTFSDIDLRLRPDQPVVAISQVTNIPDVSIVEAFGVAGGVELYFEDPKPRREHLPTEVIATTSGYRVRCPRLAGEEWVELVVAIAAPNPQPPPGQLIGNPDAIVTISVADKVDGTVRDVCFASREHSDAVWLSCPAPREMLVDGRFVVLNEVREFKFVDQIMDPAEHLTQGDRHPPPSRS